MAKISIRFLLVAVILLVSLVGMLLFHGVFGNLTYAAFSQLDLQIITQNVEQSRLKLDALIDKTASLSQYLLSNLLPGDGAGKESFQKAAHSALGSSDALHSIFLLDEGGKMLAFSSRGALKAGYDAAGEDWFAAASASREPSYSLPHIQRARSGAYPWVVSIVYPLRTIWEGEELSGYLVLDLSTAALREVCAAPGLEGEGYLYITDGAGTLVYTPRARADGLRFIAGAFSAALVPGAQFRQLEVSAPAKNGSWVLAGMIRESGLRRSAEAFQARSLSLLLVCILLSLLLANVTSALIVKPILNMERAMGNAGTVRDLRLRPSGTREFIRLAGRYNALLDQIDGLIKDATQKQAQLRTLELAALQDQINPHFLYNTLDSIVWTLEDERPKEAIEMVEALAKLLRLSIHRGGNFHTVENEIEHARNYLVLQSARLSRRFRYEIEAQSEALGLYCPKIILQPLIENAIKYGVAHLSGRTVRLRVYLQGGELKMQVYDDGMGIESATLERLQAQMLKNPPPGGETGEGGIGIKNVNRRIKLLCGEEYGLRISSEMEEWTCVSYSLPLQSHP
ncbi:MAG: sensor histidine kinase [Christensenellaceae bacterium]|jgi:two-component system sensor histidine kinase YesM|nr:sensor histidine kinase [Christensenellaceae bacterium]